MSLASGGITRLVLAGLLVALVGCGVYFEWYQAISQEALQELVVRLGPLAPVAFVGLFVLGELAQIPSVLFVLAAGLVWPFWTALPIAFAGAMAAATVAFLVARHVLGKQIADRLPSGWRRYSDAIATNGMRAVAMIRLTTFLHPAMHWVLAGSRVSLRDFLLGTLVGITPAVVLLVALGEVFLDWWERYSQWLLAAMVVFAIAYVAYRRHAAPPAEPASDDGSSSPE